MTLFDQGKKVYRRLKKQLLGKHKGRVVAIEPHSGDYILGKDELDAAIKALHKHPGKIFAFFRIGYPAVHKLRRK